MRRRAEDLLKWLNGWEITNSLLGTKSITDIQSIIFSLLQVSSEHGGGGWPCCNTLLIHFNDSIIEQSVIILFWEFSRIVRDCLPINIYTICWKPLLSTINVFELKRKFSLIFGFLVTDDIIQEWNAGINLNFCLKLWMMYWRIRVMKNHHSNLSPKPKSGPALKQIQNGIR